jgi:hypothetical protein
MINSAIPGGQFIGSVIRHAGNNAIGGLRFANPPYVLGDPVGQSAGWAKAHLRRAHHFFESNVFTASGGHAAERVRARPLCPPYATCRQQIGEVPASLLLRADQVIE